MDEDLEAALALSMGLPDPRTLSRSIIADQDREYEESLMLDRIKQEGIELEKKRLRLEREREKKESERREERLLQSQHTRNLKREQQTRQLRDEYETLPRPGPNDKDVLNVKFVFPDGSSVSEPFYCDYPLNHLVTFATLELLERGLIDDKKQRFVLKERFASVSSWSSRNEDKTICDLGRGRLLLRAELV